MRIYVPLLAADVAALRRDVPPRSRLALVNGRAAWAVTDASRADRAGEDVEDLEYDALQDAAYADLEDPARRADGAHRRIGILAGDVPESAVRDASATGGAFGVRLTRAEELKIASLHVTEQGATAIRDDDTEPALLWFDVAELAAGFDYLSEPSA